MASTSITTPNPTLSEIALEQGFTIEECRQAVVNRGIPIKDNRIDRLHIADVYFGVREIRKEQEEEA